MAAKEDLIRASVERLCEDEALRGDLSDAGFGPLLDWGIAALKAYAVKVADPAALEKYADAVSDVLGQAVAAAEAGVVSDSRALARCVLESLDEALRRLQAIRLGEDADANAVRIAAWLQSTLQPVATGKAARSGSKPRRPPDKPAGPKS